ncbi:S1C family serine protease [Bifidobacterium sp.]|jgi:putative serine protease PepD|uniref:S1C family serine protease n=1 Tax=Bifidobacterium sp. TaxID=41200 RepID=UPI0025C2C85B|nr:trypsin-like peptidase domain-containing protein [Bifidobacterium sp.]MCH4209718.1 trypsin-like peptidase domain-containing protein [Bifidobacterium sp.]MCI1224512.1 trypsin-like peptidase domain-containing protein [Bifidobacterium sp.]
MAEEHDGDWNAQNAQNGAEEHDNPSHEGAEGWNGPKEDSRDLQHEAQEDRPTISLQPLGSLDSNDAEPSTDQAQDQAYAQDSDPQNDDHNGDTDSDAGDDPSQTAVIEQGIPAAAASSGQATTQIPTTGSGAQQPTAPLYRPAPEYGAYGPVPPQPQNGNSDAGNVNAANSGSPYGGAPYGNNSQPEYGAYGSGNGPASGAQSNAQQDNGQSDGQSANGQQGQQGNRNPYFGANPFFNPGGQRPNARFANGQQGSQGQQSYNPGNPAQGQQAPQGQSYPPQGPFANNQTPRAMAPNRPVNAIVVAVVAALVSAALCLGIGYAAATNGWVKFASTSSLSSVGSSQSSSGTAPLESGTAADWTAVSNAVSGSVVAIQTQVSGGVAKGSGAILDTKGHIVTNNHVISGARQIQVTLANGQIYTAQVVGTDTTTDLAVIKLDNPPSNLKPVEFADSDSLAVGQGVMAIGNPLGYDDTATTGIVSALNRPVSVSDDSSNTQIVTNAVQIDAAINPGNSGGPTFDASGKVIGINSSIASTATTSSEAGSIGIGFAIPANLVKRVSQEIIDNGSVKHVQLGVTISDATAQADGVTRGGTKIASVVSGSSADKAGLKVGDTIVAFNDQAVNNTYSLLGYVRASALNDKVKLTIVRDSKTIDVDVTLDQQETASTSSQSGSSNSQNNNDNGDGDSGNDNGDGNGFTDPFGQW